MLSLAGAVRVRASETGGLLPCFGVQDRIESRRRGEARCRVARCSIWRSFDAAGCGGATHRVRAFVRAGSLECNSASHIRILKHLSTPLTAPGTSRGPRSRSQAHDPGPGVAARRPAGRMPHRHPPTRTCTCHSNGTQWDAASVPHACLTRSREPYRGHGFDPCEPPASRCVHLTHSQNIENISPDRHVVAAVRPCASTASAGAGSACIFASKP